MPETGAISAPHLTCREGGTTIRVAHFVLGRCNPDSSNGTDKSVYYLGRSQAALGHDVAIYSITDKPPIPVPGCEVKTYPARRLPSMLAGLRLEGIHGRSPFNLPLALTTDLLSWRPSIVHFHVIHVPQAIRLARLLRRNDIAYCVSIHGGLTVEAQRRRRFGKALLGFLFERAYLDDAAFLHAVSAADVVGVKAYGSHNRFVTAPNCIDPSLLPRDLDSTLLSRRMPDIAGSRVFLFVGRIAPEQKGLDMLLHAWAGMPSREGLVLILAGPDWRKGRARLQMLVDAHGIADSVRFFGRVSGKEKWDLLASSDVFVHVSRWEAGVPFSVLEAMLASKAQLLAEPVDPDQLVVRGKAAIVVSPDEASIRSGLIKLAEMDEGGLASLGRASRELIDRDLRWEKTTKKLLDAYEEAVALRHARRRTDDLSG